MGIAFNKIWQDFKKSYINGIQDLPLQLWLPQIAGILVSPKSASFLDTLKLSLGIRYTDSHGWLKLTHVLDGGLAQQAGLAPNDLISSINGQRVTSTRLDKILASLTEGQSIHLCFYRDDLEHERIASLHASQLPTQFELITNTVKQ
jgi:predicted metalloprotease with PDZ domain